MFFHLKIIFIFSFFLFTTFSYGSEDRNQYPGVVELITTDDSKHIIGQGSAVFTKPDTLVTAAHVIHDLNDNVEKNLFFIDPKTKKKIFIKKISHLDLKYDLAVLKTDDYRSNTYYPIQPKKLNNLSNISLIGFPDGNFRFIRGHVLSQFDFFMEAGISKEVHGGFSGGAVFQSDTNKLTGIIVRHLGVSSYIQYVSASKIRQLLSQKPLNCTFKKCVENQLNTLISEAKNNDAIAQYSLSIWYKNNKQNQESLHWLKQAFNNKLPVATFSLGLEYFLGKNVEQDIEEAMDLYKISAQQGFIPAQHRVGKISLFGIINLDIAVNYKDAFDYIGMAANNHYTPSEYLFGMMFYLGKGVKTDYDEAARWIIKAADKEYARAQLQLGLMHLYGHGVEEDIDQAKLWINRAAEQGLQEAKLTLLLLP